MPGEKFKKYSPFRYTGNRIYPEDLGIPAAIGIIYYVDNDAGSDNYDGLTPETALKTVQAGINLCTTGNNDYVIVFPTIGHYDITAAITVAKSCIHIIAPAGGTTGGLIPNNSTTIHQNTASTDVIQLTLLNQKCVEIAGFFIKTSNDGGGINTTTTSYNSDFHDNLFEMNTSAGAGIGAIAGSGAANLCSYHHNYIFANAGTTPTVASFISVGATSTRFSISDNILVTGSGVTVTVGISATAITGVVARNILLEQVVQGGGLAGTFTHGIDISFSSVANDNKFSMASYTNAIYGGTANKSGVENFAGTVGGTLVAL